MAVPVTAVTGPLADLRLADLGLTATDLQEAVRYGYAYAAGCTANDPLVLPSTLAWGKGTGHLRDSAKPRGWKADRLENFESVVHRRAHTVSRSQPAALTPAAATRHRGPGHRAVP